MQRLQACLSQRDAAPLRADPKIDEVSDGALRDANAEALQLIIPQNSPRAWLEGVYGLL
jgi:hypothetical protein